MADKVERIYTNFRGVDFRGDDVHLSRSPDSVNMWRNYRETSGIRTRPRMGLGYDCKNVFGVFFYNGWMVLHCGKTLEILKGNGKVEYLHNNMNEARSRFFVFKEKLYVMDGVNYLVYDGETCKDVCEDAFVPTTRNGAKPAGGGNPYQDVNLLSDYKKNSFLADGESKEYYLDAMAIDAVTEVRINGEIQGADQYSVDTVAGKVTFKTAPSVPLTDGQDNVVITYKRTVAGHRDKILKCTLVQFFDNRIFVSGNDEYPNAVWHCNLEDPSYFSDLDEYGEGLYSSRVRGLVVGNNALWVFCEPSDANTTIFYHTPTTDDEYGKVYPYVHSSIATGCVGAAINFNDDIVFFSDRGMEGISGDITTEQVVAHRSTLVDRKLLADSRYKDMILAEWEGYLVVIIGNRAFLADSRAVFTNEHHYEYEWFYWDLEQNITCAYVYEGVLYLGRKDALVCIDPTQHITNTRYDSQDSYWTTPKDKFGQPHKLKTTNKRGCVAEATGYITVYAKVEDTEFEEIGKYENVTDYFVSRIKRKKFKDIQLKFYSLRGFSLESVTLEAYLGGYIKR